MSECEKEEHRNIDIDLEKSVKTIKQLQAEQEVAMVIIQKIQKRLDSATIMAKFYAGFSPNEYEVNQGQKAKDWLAEK